MYVTINIYYKIKQINKAGYNNMFNIPISGKTAIQFYLMAKEIQNIPVDVLILVWQDIHAKEDDKLIIEFTKLKKQAYADKLHIKEDMINKYLKRLVDNDFITPIEGFRGAYTYKPNAELDYIMYNILDNSFVMTIASNNDFKGTEFPSTKKANKGN